MLTRKININSNCGRQRRFKFIIIVSDTVKTVVSKLNILLFGIVTPVTTKKSLFFVLSRAVTYRCYSSYWYALRVHNFFGERTFQNVDYKKTKSKTLNNKKSKIDSKQHLSEDGKRWYHFVCWKINSSIKAIQLKFNKNSVIKYRRKRLIRNRFPTANIARVYNVDWLGRARINNVHNLLCCWNWSVIACAAH